MKKSAFLHHELKHLLDRKQRSAVQPEGGSMTGAQFYCSTAFFLFFPKTKAIIHSLITRKLSWLLSRWPFCIFPPHSLWRATSVWHHRLQSVENLLLFHVIAEIMDSVPWSVWGCTAAITHFKAEWWYGLSSMECWKHRHSPRTIQLLMFFVSVSVLVLHRFFFFFWVFLWSW